MWVDLDVRGQQLMDFITRENVIMHYELHIWTWSDGLKLKCFNDGFVSYKHANFHSTKMRVWTLIVTAPIHCRASIAEKVM